MTNNCDVKPLNFQEIIEKLAEVNQWLCQIGLNRPDRIRSHLRNLTELAKAHDRETPDQIAVNLTSERRRERFWSIVESIEFVDATSASRRGEFEIPKQVLEKALNGPADLYLENHKSNEGRNTMFEIVVGGLAASAGLSPLLGAEPDVSFEFENRRILVQCKRVLSKASIDTRIKEAAKQLNRDLVKSSNPRDCGLIAICLSRLINPGDRIFSFTAVVDVECALKHEIRKVADEHHERVFPEVKNPKIAGILLYMATPVFVSEHGFTVAHSAMVCPIPGKSDVRLLKALASILKT